MEVVTLQRILVINGSYRDDGTTDRAVDAALSALPGTVETEVVNLRDYPIEFCLNCRECTQQPGSEPGRCVLDDGMHALIDKIERADAYILASPTNFSSVTAVFKRFMERLIPYAYWPWGQPYPKFRKQGSKPKKALLITSSAAPAWIGRWLYGTPRQLKMVAQTIGARSIGLLYTGLAGEHRQDELPQKAMTRAQRLAQKLIAG